MTQVSLKQNKGLDISSSVKFGAQGGLAGGLAFGLLMWNMGMLPMVGMLVGIDSAAVGFVVHMGISAFFGAIYGTVAARFALTPVNATIGGIVSGIFWWVLGALTMMPLMLGMNEMLWMIGPDQWLSLVGHLIYGLITAFVFVSLAKRNSG